MNRLSLRSGCLTVLGIISLVRASTLNAEGNKTLREGTALEAVRKVFETAGVRPLNRSNFGKVSPCFSIAMGRKVENFLKALDDLMARRNEIAKQADITTDGWWPPTAGIDVHLALKGDLLTYRAGVPDKLEIGQPLRHGNHMKVTVIERYIEIADDGTDLGGTKTCRVDLIPEDNKWVINEIQFRTQQYGRESKTTLTAILERRSKELRTIRAQMHDFRNETRSAVPVTSPSP